MGNRVVAVVGVLWAFSSVWLGTISAQEAENKQVGQFLSDVKSLAGLIKSDIATLGFFALSGGEWQTRDVMLKLYTERVNTLRTQASRLEAIRKEGSHPQQIAAERIVPVMKELASIADAAVRSTKSNPKRISTADYRQYLKLTSDLADQLSAMIGACVDYAKTREDLDRFSEKIGASSASH